MERETHRLIKGQGYPIYVEEHTGDLFRTWLNEQPEFSSVYILVDENTHTHCLPLLDQWGIALLKTAEVIEIPSGEAYKVVEVCTQIWEAMLDLGADRHALLINLGGGVIGDMGGFAAATYQRGIRFVQLPTTLLSMVDASVGGKLGIDLHGLKNQVGLFQNPTAVFIDPTFLETLPEIHWRNGLAEMLKHAFIGDSSSWQELINLDVGALEEGDWTGRIARSVAFKNAVVQRDPKEAGERMILNFGHTVGHGLESTFLENPDQMLFHGEAVAAGMVAEAWLSTKLLGLSQEACTEMAAVVKRFYQPVQLDEGHLDQIMQKIRSDKKNKGDVLRFALVNAVGSCRYGIEVSPDLVRQSLAYYQEMMA